MNVNIDFNDYNHNSNGKYRGFGMVSSNNSSRLLIDYKYDKPKKYKEILTRLFGVQYIGITHLKLEMGSDVNSSSGTEPAIKRFLDEKPDVTRGAGYILAADAKKINPQLTLDLLFWSEPAWVSNSDDVYEARFQWYKDTLVEAYVTFGLKFDYISVSRNERAIDIDWIKYIAKRMKEEQKTPYDFSDVKIVAADEDNSWKIADLMLEDEELCSAVDVIGTHYTSHSTDNAKYLLNERQKELWFSEGSAPMCYAKGISRFDGNGLTGINGILDIANRIIAMYACGRMTMYEFQPAVAAYYDGVTFCHKELIAAHEPWSGYYSMSCGYYMALHFSCFIRKGWSFIDGACDCDAKVGGDGHALVEAKYSYLTATDPDTGDFSQVIVNATSDSIAYVFTIKNVDLNGKKVSIWKTSDAQDVMKKDYLSVTGSKIITDNSYELTIPPHSIITVTTLSVIFEADMSTGSSKILKLPYFDDYEYNGIVESFLSKRGGAPKYTTDQGGAFEVINMDNRNVLMQKITRDIIPEEWGKTPEPVTCFGDDRWFNYSYESKITFAQNESEEVYAGIGVRYSLGVLGQSGYSLICALDGKWKLSHNNQILLNGCIELMDKTVILKLTVIDNVISGFADGCNLFKYTITNKAIAVAGRAALYSSYHNNYFEYSKVTPESNPYIAKIDDTDYSFTYEGSWNHELMSSFTNYKRTLSSGKEDARCIYEFTGSKVALFGVNDGNGCISIELDGIEYIEEYDVPKTSSRDIFLQIKNLKDMRHILTIKVISGTLNIDGALLEAKDEI